MRDSGHEGVVLQSTPHPAARRGEPDGDHVPIVYHQVAFFDVRVSDGSRKPRRDLRSLLLRPEPVTPRLRTRSGSAASTRSAPAGRSRRFFADRAISGASAIRPGYQALLAAVVDGRIDTVLAEALDRLSRDQEDIAALHKRLRFLGVRLVTVSEGEIGDLHVGLKGAMNALYLKDLADKTRRGLKGRVRAGRSGGGLCYGYDVVPGEERGGRTINADEAAIVRRIFTEFAAGRSPKAIARRLNDDGIPARAVSSGATPRSAATASAAPAFSTTSSTSDGSSGTGCAT
jgi:DNA invertase Pin-like site-specific DNA recombinase